MSEYLFLYGTLQPGRAPEEIAPTVGKLRRVGPGRVRGVLYDLGNYPGAVLDRETDSEIEGIVYELPADADILSALDAYEEFDPEAPETSLFLRVSHPVVLDDGETPQCWLYVFNHDPAGAPILS